MKVGLLHPGEMGSAVGAALVGAGHDVCWASEGRSPATAERAEAAGLVDVRTPGEVAEAPVVVSVCPPAAAREVARLVAEAWDGPAGPRPGLFVDANAISPDSARQIGAAVTAAGGRLVDGGIVGPPPVTAGTTRLFLSGPDAVEVSELFATPLVETVVTSDEVGAASALKAAYAAWTKGSAALLLAVRAAAAAEGVEPWLLDEWRISQPALADRSLRAAVSARTKGWRWDGEMEEIADMFAGVGLPDGFHRAAAEIFRRCPRVPGPLEDPPAVGLEDVVRALLS